MVVTYLELYAQAETEGKLNPLNLINSVNYAMNVDDVMEVKYPDLVLGDLTVIYETEEELNLVRTAEVANITVTLADTVTILDGDEVSQGRMGRAILALADDIATTTWIGANGDVYNLTRPQFQEALTLAGEAQTAIWVNYATLKATL